MIFYINYILKMQAVLVDNSGTRSFGGGFRGSLQKPRNEMPVRGAARGGRGGRGDRGGRGRDRGGRAGRTNVTRYKESAQMGSLLATNKSFSVQRLLRDYNERKNQSIPLLGVSASPLEDTMFIWHANIKSLTNNLYKGKKVINI